MKASRSARKKRDYGTNGNPSTFRLFRNLSCCTLPANDICRNASFFRRQRMNRRKFLQAGSGLALTAALGTGRHSYAEEFAQRKLRVGLIGSGWYGKCDLLRLIQVAPVEVVSLC